MKKNLALKTYFVKVILKIFLLLNDQNKFINYLIQSLIFKHHSMLARHMSTFYNLTLTTACASSSPLYGDLHMLCVLHPHLSITCTLNWPLDNPPPSKTHQFPFSNLPMTYHGIPPELCIESLLSSAYILATWSCPLPLIPLSTTLSLVTYHKLPPEFGVHLGYSIMPPTPPLSLVTYHKLPPELGIHLGYLIVPPPPFPFPLPHPWRLTMDSLLSSAYILATRSWSIWWSLGCTLFLQ